jgi:hypothetical protein
MTRLLFLAASLGLAVSGAQACDFMKSAATADTIQTASVSTEESASTQQSAVLPMSTPATVVTSDSATSGTVVTGQSE